MERSVNRTVGVCAGSGIGAKTDCDPSGGRPSTTEVCGGDSQRHAKFAVDFMLVARTPQAVEGLGGGEPVAHGVGLHGSPRGVALPKTWIHGPRVGRGLPAEPGCFACRPLHVYWKCSSTLYIIIFRIIGD